MAFPVDVSTTNSLIVAKNILSTGKVEEMPIINNYLIPTTVI